MIEGFLTTTLEAKPALDPSQLYSIKTSLDMNPNAPELARTQGKLWFLIFNK